MGRLRVGVNIRISGVLTFIYHKMADNTNTTTTDMP